MMNLDKEPFSEDKVFALSEEKNIPVDNVGAIGCVNEKGHTKENMYTLHKSEKFRNRTYKLKEEDFYPPEDTRTWRSGVKDIPLGDTFEEYFRWFYEVYDDIFDN